MILRSEQIVKYGDGTMKKIEELGEIPEAVLYPDTQVEVEPDEPTIDLEDYIEDIAKDAVKGCIFVTSLPDVSEADENTIYVLNVFEAEHNITIFDESDDKDQFIGAEKVFSDSWSNYSSVVFTGGNNQNGDVWSMCKH